jgi:hypothetical protein
MTDGDMVAEGLSDLSPDLRKRLTTGWDEIRSELLPDITGTASPNLLGQLGGVELVFADTEERAAEQVSRICISAGALGLDVETAPRSEFLPVRWPIASRVTSGGRRFRRRWTPPRRSIRFGPKFDYFR